MLEFNTGSIPNTDELKAFPDADLASTPYDLIYQPSIFRSFAFSTPYEEAYAFATTKVDFMLLRTVVGNSYILTSSKNLSDVMVKRSDAPKRNIAYNANGGTTGIDTTSITISIGSSYTVSPYDTSGLGVLKEGLGFKGWNTQANGLGQSYPVGTSIPVTLLTDNTNLTLYAQWEANSYTLSF